MLELNVKPRKVTVQIMNRRGFWTDVFTSNSHEPFADDVIYGLVSAPTSYKIYHLERGIPKTRILSGKGKQLISSTSLDFMIALDNANLVSGQYLKDKEIVIYNMIGHDRFSNGKEELQQQFELRNGIRKATKRKPDKDVKCIHIWDVLFNDSSKATYVLYK